MNSLFRPVSGLLLLFLCLTAWTTYSPEWGFFVHRRINRLAVFTLPEEMIGFYKKNIEYITAHATDPDMRRYVVPVEGRKHYIDLDYWDNPPDEYYKAQWQIVQIQVINSQKDTLTTFGPYAREEGDWNVELTGKNFPLFFKNNRIVLLKEDAKNFFYKNIYRTTFQDTWELNCDSLQSFFADQGFELDCQKAFAVDTMAQHGVQPYNLLKTQNRLTEAMLNGNVSQILRLSADLGHYIGDAHVPLHTHSNYNGQKSDQYGIHAFWETRLPELFADEQYDYFAGKADYIYEPVSYYWEVVRTSHSLVEDVLGIEKELSRQFPSDEQKCFVERGEGYIQEMACEEYATAYHEQLNGMVEDRLRASIKSVGDAWYTAWVDAGQPDLKALLDNRDKTKEMKEAEELMKAVKGGKMLGREHQQK